MTPLQSRIMASLRASNTVLSADELSDRLKEPVETVTDALHDLQDSGDVYLSAGWYRPSEAHKARFGMGA